ncbi:magnesium and cobalt transport protein CorA [Demequina sp. NBRC 110054]|uniref:magnesium and cobalt transport protein CorA n=1 Tax=Demequina sp. NBRC 110054 TaxID=1570343 RepID=UPI001F42DD2C|nr:magnesium and cobalt transport protein CorA [Demequina sp. NBRC 110054]
MRRSRQPRPAVADVTPRVGHLVRYVEDGRVVQTLDDGSPSEALEYAGSSPTRLAMSLYPAPTEAQVEALADAWELHPVLKEDLLLGQQRPKAERYGDVLFLVVRSARYLDDAERVELAEFHILVRPNAVAILCQDNEWVDGTDAEGVAAAAISKHRYGAALFESEHLLRLGPEAVAYWLLDIIVDAYAPVLAGLEVDKEQVERQVFAGDAAATERVYRLGQEVIDLQHAVTGMGAVLEALRRGVDKHGLAPNLQTYLQDVSDHHSHAATRVLELRETFAQILDVNATLVAQRQNEDMKKISGWAAILFAPTLIAAIYGMNFRTMPELGWAWGYPMALGGMGAFAVVLWLVFKRNRWM